MKRKKPPMDEAATSSRYHLQGRRPPAAAPDTSNNGGGDCHHCFFPTLVDSSTSSSSSSSPSKDAASNNASRRTHRSLPQGERLLIEDMNKLTLEERQKVYEEVHGVIPDDPITQETEEIISQAMTKMMTYLSSQPNRKMPAYERAAFLVPQPMKDRAFLLKFLRREQFDAEKAGQLLRRYLEFGHCYFGMNALLRDVTMSDLDDDDLQALRTAAVQPLPHVQDRAGRPIILFFSSRVQFKVPENVIRVMFYLYTTILRNPVAQTKGVIILSWNFGDYIPAVPPSIIGPTTSLYSSIPLYVASCHMCYNQISMMPLLELTRLAMGRHTRIRMRTHFGSRLECKYALLTFGIDASTFPLNPKDDSMIESQQYLAWLDQQKAQEDQEDQARARATHNILPSTHDILLGRGQPFRVFPGNQALATMVEAHHAEYESLRGPQRRLLLDRIAAQLLDGQGRRVLKRDDSSNGSWYVASRKEAKKKIDISFRNKKLVDKYHHEKQQAEDLDEVFDD